MKPVFDKVVGQRPVKQLLINALENRSYSHAYLFEGTRGLGKETMAREYAAAILCASETPPCHTCRSCQQVTAGTHPELRIILPEDPEKDTSVSVEIIRSMIKDIYLKPYEGDWKVYLIPQADLLTFQAQNALLKTLEEPPDHSVIILTSSHPEKLLPTVLSRCQKAVFRPVKAQELEMWLQSHHHVSQQQANDLAAYANGIPDRAVKMVLSEVYRQQRQGLLALTDTLAEGRISPLLEEGQWLQLDKTNTLEVLSMWQEWIRDIQVLSLEGSVDLLINPDQLERLQYQEKRLYKAGYAIAMGMLEEAQEDIRNHGNLAFVSDMLLVNLLNCLMPPGYLD